MTRDDIERALREDDTIVPSSGFKSSVMRAIRQESEDLGSIRFPWSRVVPGLIVCVTVVGVAIVFGDPAAEPFPFAEELGRSLQRFPAETIGWVLAPLVASWFAVRFSLRLVGYRS